MRHGPPWLTVPVGVADRALPVRRADAHAALAADAVAAAAAHVARVPELPQRPLAAGAGPLAVLPGTALGASPPELLELTLHPPAIEGTDDFKEETATLPALRALYLKRGITLEVLGVIGAKNDTALIGDELGIQMGAGGGEQLACLCPRANKNPALLNLTSSNI